MMSEAPDLHGIDLNLLPKFRALYRHRSVSEAARELYLTQSALSNALAKMRSLFSDELFVRTATGMEPTPLAHLVAEPIEQALTQLQTEFVRARGFNPRQSRRTFRIAMTQLGEVWLAPRILAIVQNAAPDIVLGSILADDRGVERALSNGNIDFAIGHLPGLGLGFRDRELAIHEFVCVLRNGHPALQNGAVTLQALMGCTFVESAASRYRTSNVLALPYVIAATDLVARIPAWFAAGFPSSLGLRMVRLPEETRKSISVFWHENFERDPGHRWMRSVIERAAKLNAEGGFDAPAILTATNVEAGAA
jgi:DNA-binding transcriptional LysR family regulator